ncbi:MAG: hypothetical protein E3J34_01780 [Dehalococcoidia bacterium]|nr:MAG: hypothetical protein E3J34_01780 [Dehalococcoidia bacterium]
MLEYDRYWPAFCEVAGIKELEKDPRFENIRAVIEHMDEAIPMVGRIIAAKPRAEWMRILTERDLNHAPIQKVADLVNDPQAIANDYIVEFEHPSYGREKMVGFPYRFSETQA